VTDNLTELPDAKDEIKDVRRKEFIQSLKRPPLLIAGLVILLICAGGLGGAAYLLIPKNPTPTITDAFTSTASTGTITPEPTKPSTSEATREVTRGIARTPTESPGVKPTQVPAVDATDTSTVEVVMPTPTPTSIQNVSPSTIVDPATLPGKIAAPVFNNQTNTYDLYIASAPEWQPVLFQQGASQPAFSPDGTQIVFRSWGGEVTPFSEQLVIRDVVGSYDRLITTHPEDARPHWADFDMPIVFHSRPAGASAHVYLQGLWQGAPEDPNSRRESVVGENPTWLPDGRIVYASGEPVGRGLYVMNGDGGGVRLLWPSSDLVAPKGAPHSNRVVFSYNDDLYLLTVTEGPGEPRLLPGTPKRELLPVWSPDEQFIAFVRDQGDNNWAVYVMRADGTGEIKLFDLPGSIDGNPINVPPGKSFGWREEQLAWGL
jgi:hypothetical protein